MVLAPMTGPTAATAYWGWVVAKFPPPIRRHRPTDRKSGTSSRRVGSMEALSRHESVSVTKYHLIHGLLAMARERNALIIGCPLWWGWRRM